MNIGLKSPIRGLNIAIILTISGILIGFPPSFESRSQITEEDLEIPKYLTIQSNSFLPISFLASTESSLHQTYKEKALLSIVTAYHPVEWETDEDPCIVASGINACQADKNIIACPRKYPFGTKVMIEGKIYICEDRTNKKYDGVFDIFLKTEEEALKWGKRLLPVNILN